MPPPNRPADPAAQSDQVLNGELNNSHGTKDLITVLVTGFGPWDERYPINPSWEIARSLPALFPARDDSKTRIQIITCDQPLRVSYKHCRNRLPKLLEDNSDAIDLVLLTGMASGRKFYTAERYARRIGYSKHRDIDGEFPPPSEPEDQFADLPDVMTTSLNYNDMLSRWQAAAATAQEGTPLHGADCRMSEDAGRFLCDYSYFNVLAWFAQRHSSPDGGAITDRPAMFLHVPAESTEADLERGRAVAVALIESMADGLHKQKSPQHA